MAFKRIRVGRYSATNFIVEFLAGIRRPATTSEIREALRENEIPIRDDSLNWALTNLNTMGKIRRVRRGVYEAPNASTFAAPEITNRTELESWLAGKSPLVAQVIAMRLALRLLPIAASDAVRDFGSRSPRVLTTIFRAAAVCWTACRYSGRDLAPAARAVGDSIDRLSRTSKSAALNCLGEAAHGLVLPLDALNAAGNASAFINSAAGGPTEAGDLWASVTADLRWIEAGPSKEDQEISVALAKEPLGLVDVRGDDRHRVSLPAWERKEWDDLKASAERVGDFGLWFRWYEARLRGLGVGGFTRSLESFSAESSAKSIDLRVSGQSDEFWARPISEINANILRWVEEAFRPPLFNLIVSGQGDTWRGASAVLDRSRFLEYTSEDLVSRFGNLDADTRDRLTDIPTLFAYETAVGQPARVGKIIEIQIQGARLHVKFEFDSTIPAIPASSFARLLPLLGMDTFEQHRTHWAIKTGQLHSILEGEGLLSNPPQASVVEPSPGPGPQYQLLLGKLSEQISLPHPDEVERQVGLHRRVRQDAKSLADALGRVVNRFPELATIAQEYAALIDVRTEETDVPAVWSVGGSLASFARAYRDQNIAKTMAEPLEPQIDALLQSVVRQHGALIMGFEEGRDLVTRADEFAVDIHRLAEVEPPGFVLLTELTQNRELVDDKTRALHAPVLASVTEFGWAASRAGYSAYLIVRNSVRAMIKLGVGENLNLVSTLGLLTVISTIAGDPSLEFIRAVYPVFRDHASQLLSFFNHSPEMRAYVEWALYTLRLDGGEED